MTIVYAHRGARAEEPENTLPAFRRALELGVDALETDVHLTSDGHVVAVHDADVRRVAGVARLVGRATLDEVQTWDAGFAFVAPDGSRPFRGKGYRIPTLDELLVELAPAHLNVDLKSDEPELVDRFLRTVRNRQAEDRVTAASFRSSPLRLLRARGYAGEVALSRRDFLGILLLPRRLRSPAPANRAQIPTRVGPFSLGSRRIVDTFHREGLKVDYWIVNDPDEARKLVEIGADGVMTDDPRRVVPAVRSAAEASA